MFRNRKPAQAALLKKRRLLEAYGGDYIDWTWRERDRMQAAENVARLLVYYITRKQSRA